MSEAENPFETPRSDAVSISKRRSWKRIITATIETIILLYGMLGVVLGLLVYGTDLIRLFIANPVYVLRLFCIPIVALLLGSLLLKRAFRPIR